MSLLAVGHENDERLTEWALGVGPAIDGGEVVLALLDQQLCAEPFPPLGLEVVGRLPLELCGFRLPG